MPAGDHAPSRASDRLSAVPVTTNIKLVARSSRRAVNRPREALVAVVLAGERPAIDGDREAVVVLHLGVIGVEGLHVQEAAVERPLPFVSRRGTDIAPMKRAVRK